MNTYPPRISIHTVDVNRLDVLHLRSIGAETLCLHALMQLSLDDKLRALGFNEKDISAAIGTVIRRTVHPGSERETHRRLQHTSAQGELIDHDCSTCVLRTNRC